MSWEKRGLIFCPSGQSEWAKHSFMTPTPWQLDKNTIRLFGGMRDQQGVSRLGYIDLESENPSIIKKISQEPILDVGLPGTFDDNGIILGDIIRSGDNQIYMYYVGFQLVEKVKFLAFSGLAISSDNGHSFKRYKNTPILDRTDECFYIRAVHSVLLEEGKWRFWCGAGRQWQYFDGLPYPAYGIWYTESSNGLSFPEKDRIVIEPGETEYRIGRPRVYKALNGYEMYFTYDTINKEYCSGYAESQDGLKWKRDDSKFPIQRSRTGWDSEMVCYPTLHITPQGKKYLFYSGNGMGRTGVGYAEWKS